MGVRFSRRTVLPASTERCFDLALDVDVHLESFSDSGEQIVGGVEAGGMRLGDDVTWRARHFGIWWTMTSQITAFDRPHSFVDEQVKGPFASFRHLHVFTDLGDGSTEMIDEVEFEAPLGPLGLIAEKAVLGRYMPHLIDVRNRELLVQVQRV
ncbi:MAG: SRPBCC family protein [Ilumatobacter sp.]|uniref:SRPBCC family protein n=1 Tax=Ilumatobacter sp. TaxID=1967498 RepID=UPI003297E4B7